MIEKIKVCGGTSLASICDASQNGCEKPTSLLLARPPNPRDPLIMTINTGTSDESSLIIYTFLTDALSFNLLQFSCESYRRIWKLITCINRLELGEPSPLGKKDSADLNLISQMGLNLLFADFNISLRVIHH